MITREQIKDLRPGDVVKVDFGDGSYLQGPLRSGRLAELLLSPFLRLRRTNGDCSLPAEHTLTVVSRAQPPLYVNHDRTEPVPGDVARNAAGHLRVCQESPYPNDSDVRWWGFGVQPYGVPGRWSHCSTSLFRDDQPLTLLVDGEIGQVVP